MTNELSLKLNQEKDIELSSQANNIITNISEAFSNAVKKGAEKLELPDGFGEKVKEGLEKIDLKEIGESVAETALKAGMKSLGMKTSTFNSLKSIFEAIKEGDLKKGLNSGFNVAISLLKLPTTVKTAIKSGKDVVLEQVFDDELKAIMKKEQNTISRIDKKCLQMEEAFKTDDVKTLDKVAKTLKKDLDKVMPIQNVIEKGQGILNQYELYKNKENKQLTADEKELCLQLA